MQIAQRIIAKVSVLSNLQRRFLVIVTQSVLYCRHRVNYSTLARVSEFNEKTFRRHFASSVNFSAVHRAVIDTVLPSTRTGLRVIAFDPTFLPKSGEHTEGLGMFWNGSESRAEHGLEATVMAIVEVSTRKALTLAVQQTHAKREMPTKDATTKDATTKDATTKDATTKDATTKDATTKDVTLIDEYLRHITAVVPLLTEREKHLVVDGYFAKKKFLNGVEAMNLYCITKLRADANMKYLYHGKPRPSGRGRQKVYEGKVCWKSLKTEYFQRIELTTAAERGIVLLTGILYHSGFKRQMRVVVVEIPHAKGMRRIILASTDMTLDAETIFSAYSARFQVEFLIRDAKGHTGLTDCQARSKNALHYHLNVSMLTLNLARAEHIERVGLDSKEPFSIDSIKTGYFNEHFARKIFSICGIEPEMIENQPEYQSIRNYGRIAA